MAYWQEYAGAPDVLELEDYRMNSRGDSPPARRIYAPPLPPFTWPERPLRVERPWREEPVKEAGLLTPEEKVARCDAWFFRDRPVPDRPAMTGRGRRRRSGCAESGLSFGSMWLG